MSKRIDKIEAKKLELESNITRLQQGLEQNISSVKGDVTQSVQPTQLVKKHPIQVVGAAVVLGFLLGYSGRNKSKKVRISKETNITDSIVNSLKKKVTQKAVDMAMEYVDSKLAKSKEVE